MRSWRRDKNSLLYNITPADPGVARSRGALRLHEITKRRIKFEVTRDGGIERMGVWVLVLACLPSGSRDHIVGSARSP